MRDEVPVLIVGGGPTGLLHAALLAWHGIKSLVIERHATRLTAPKAHALGPRSLEILRQTGFDISQIRKAGTPRESGRWVNFVTTLAGENLGRLPYERMDVEVLDDTPEMFHNVPQPALEDLVTKTVEHSAEIRKSHSFVSLVQEDASVISAIEDRLTGELYAIRSKYVVACDGAKSKVRQFLGVESDGEGTDMYLMTIEIDADLRPVVADKMAILYWLINPEAHGTIIAYDLSKKQVMTLNFNPKTHPVESWDEKLCRKMIDAALGVQIPYSVRSFRPWILRRQVAKTYNVGNVFLSGDAAHSFPPSAGIGLNSAIGDVHNLCWKIAAISHGWASDSLLSTYDSERRRIAEINSRQSVKNGQKIYNLVRDLSFSGATSELAWASLRNALQDPIERKTMLEKIQERSENFDNLELHLGYVYDSHGLPANPSEYRPKYVKGARLPHLWIRLLTPRIVEHSRPVDLQHIEELSGTERELRQYSTLDLCRYDSFTLIVNSDPGQAERVAELIKVLEQNKCGQKEIPLRVIVWGVDVDAVFEDRAAEWLERLRLRRGQSGGVLIRPDQHICALVDVETSAEGLLSDIESAAGW